MGLMRMNGGQPVLEGQKNSCNMMLYIHKHLNTVGRG
jgi:hypothetical protein